MQRIQYYYVDWITSTCIEEGSIESPRLIMDAYVLFSDEHTATSIEHLDLLIVSSVKSNMKTNINIQNEYQGIN